VFVDDLPVEVPAGTTVIQACAEAGVEIPRLENTKILFFGFEEENKTARSDSN
jgi:hypothetical protein